MGNVGLAVLLVLLFGALLLASAPPVAHAQQNATGNVDQLIEQLNDRDSAIRSSAAVALAEPLRARAKNSRVSSQFMVYLCTTV